MNRFFLWLMIGACCVAPFGNLLRFPLSETVSVSALDVVIGFAAAVAVFLIKDNVSKFKHSPTFRYAAAFVIFAILTLIAHSLTLGLMETSVASLYLIRLIAYGIVAAALILLPKDQKKQLTQTFAISAGAFVLGGLVQYFFFPDLRPLYYEGWDRHLFRLFGTLLDPNFTGIALLLLAGFFVQRRQQFMVALTSVALLLTYSRSTYIAAVVTILTFMWIMKAWKVGALCFIVLVLGILLLPKNLHSEGVDLLRTASIENRLVANKEAIEIWKSAPLTGIGFNAYRAARPVQKSDVKVLQNHAGAGVPNSYLFVLATTGLVGLVLFVMALVTAARSVKDPVFQALLAGVLVGALFENTLFYPFIWFVGMMVVLL